MIRTLVRPLTLVWMGVIFWLSSLESVDLGQPMIPGADKVVHAITYGILFATFIPAPRTLRQPSEWIPFALAAVFVYALTDEFHQSFVPGRDASLWDLVADVFGASVAALIASRGWFVNFKYRIL